MKKTITLITIAIVAILFSLRTDASNAMTPQEKGTEIAKKYDAISRGFIGEKGTITLTLVNAYGDKVVRKGQFVRAETKNDGVKTITMINWPADVKGTKILTWVHKNKDNSQWLYLPSLRRVKRISGRSQSGSFMGSEFSYEDMGDDDIEKYTYKFIGDKMYKGRMSWVCERYPKDKGSGYSKHITWFDQERHTLERIDYYDRKNELYKTAIYNDYKLHKGIWRVSWVRIVNHQTSKESVLVQDITHVKVKLPDSLFLPNSLKR